MFAVGSLSVVLAHLGINLVALCSVEGNWHELPHMSGTVSHTCVRKGAWLPKLQVHLGPGPSVLTEPLFCS